MTTFSAITADTLKMLPRLLTIAALVAPVVTLWSFTPEGSLKVMVCSLSALKEISLVLWTLPSA